MGDKFNAGRGNAPGLPAVSVASLSAPPPDPLSSASFGLNFGLGRADGRKPRLFVAYPVGRVVTGTRTEETPAYVHQTEFVRAILESTAALGFGVRTNVDRSTEHNPYLGPKPEIHSQLSISDQCRYPLTGTPSSIACLRPLSAAGMNAARMLSSRVLTPFSVTRIGTPISL